MQSSADQTELQNRATLVDVLRGRAQAQPEKTVFTFLADGETSQERITYAALDQRARAIAAILHGYGAAGQPVLLAYPQGLDFIAAFFGCLYVGAVAIPAEVPHPRRPPRRIASIITDARPRLALTTAEFVRRVTVTSGDAAGELLLGSTSGTSPMTWIATNEIGESEAVAWRRPTLGPESLCLLQYTSGSTRTPRGVMLSHGNLISNLQMIHECFGISSETRVCSWLPFFHDMGLIGVLLEVVYAGCEATLLSPSAFLQRPIRWLKAISSSRATHSGGPNFAYDLCASKCDSDECADLDLNHWQVAFNGAEPVRAATLDRFKAVFARSGFRAAAFLPCYGLAESTLLVAAPPSAQRPLVGIFDDAELKLGKVQVSAAANATAIVSCGPPTSGSRVVIVDPDSAQPSQSNQIGEIWVAGPHVAKGYWNRPAESDEVFAAQLATIPMHSVSDKSQEKDTGVNRDGPYLRTGDLGFLYEGELYVTGRAKELIIIRGQNHYPQDIENTVSQAHPALSLLWSAAFAVDVAGEERLVVVHELTREGRRADMDAVISAVRAAVTDEHDLQLHALVLVEPGTIPKTTSGKVQRFLCRQHFLDGQLPAVGSWIEAATTSDPAPKENACISEVPVIAKSQICDWLVAAIAARLHVTPAAIEPTVPMAHYGLDSAAIVGLAGQLEIWLGRQLSPTLLYEYPTIDTLSGFLAEPAQRDVAALRNAQAQPTEPTRAASSSEPLGETRPRHQMETREVPSARNREPIAVIGIGCRFPGAEGTEAFWKLLCAGTDAVSEAPTRDWLDNFERDGGTPAFPRWGGFLDQVDLFDARFFGIAPREAVLMDPQQRLLLEVASEAFEDAGLPASRLAGSRTGVLIGISTSEYAWATLTNADRKNLDLHAGTGSALSIAANRLSYQFDLRGASLAVDTACSSSLVAVHLACRGLWEGDYDLALAGGVNLILSRSITAAFAKARFLSPDGRCKAFDATANGYVRGEGAGIVVLKPLSRALADGDPIRAVICGGAVNQDGRSNGLTAPNPRAQMEVLRAAYQCAGIEPAAVDYIEAHGTGTALGDPIEARVLGEFLAAGGPRRRPCAIGTVKSNIGHLEAAAGIAGLIKVVLMLEHGELPVSLHFQQPNPLIPFDQFPLYVQQQRSAWPETTGPRVAGVSSFGFGGTNAHIVLASAPLERDSRRSLPHRQWQRERFWISVPADGKVQVPSGAAEPLRLQETDEQPVTGQPMASIRSPLSAPTEERRQYLEQYLRQSVAEVLGFNDGNIDVTRPLTELGLDSLMAIDLVHLAERDLQVRIPFETLLRGPSVMALADELLNLLTANQPAAGDGVPLASPPLPASTIATPALPVGGRPAQPDATTTAATPSSIPRMPRNGELPLSFSQRRLWLLDQLAEDSCLLNIPAAVRLHGRLDVAVLEQALTRLIQRHEALRTVIRQDTDRVFQVIRPPQPLVLHVLHLSPLPPVELERESMRLLTIAARQRFEPAEGPLLKVTLLRLSDNEHALLLNVSHLVSDGWSMGIIIRELAELYTAIVAGRPAQLPELSVQYADFAAWQQASKQGDRTRELLDYWRQKLGTVLPVLDLLTDHPRPPVTTFRGARRWFDLSSEVADDVLELSRREGVTPFMTLLAALKTLLFRCSGQPDVLVGTPSAGRTRQETEHLVGPLLNPLPLLTNLDGDPSIRELLHRVRDTALGAYAHQDMPFEEIVANWHQYTDVSHPPVFQVLFDLQEIGRAPFEISGLIGTRMPIDPGTAMVDLSLYLTKEPGSLHGYFEFNTDLFEPVTIDLMIGRLRTLLADIVAHPDRKVSELSILPDEERRRLLIDCNRTDIPYSRDQCLHERIEQQVARTPDAVALVCGDRQMTYAELDGRANQVARRLWRLGGCARPPKPDASATADLVAICVERSLEMVVGMLGVLKAGAAYVPIDPQFPPSRQALMLEDSRAKVVLTQKGLAAQWPSGVTVVCLDAIFGDASDESDGKLPAGEADDDQSSDCQSLHAHITADDVAYVLYTSGSTGQPKGVMVTHRNLVNFCTALDLLHGDEPPGVWLAVTSMSFDISMMELLWTLTRGFRVVIQLELPKPQPKASERGTGDAAQRKAMQFSLFYFECDEQQTSDDKYRLVLEGARFADQHGFTAIWIPERHFHPFGGLYPNPAVIASAVAAATHRIRVRAGSVVLPLHDPLRVAEEWSVVDNVSHGRVDVSFAPGSHPDDFVFAPDRYGDRKDWMLREIETVRRLWRGEPLRRLGGSGHEVEVRIYPRPVQPELPSWLTAIGPESFSLAGERGFHVLTHLLFQDPQELAEKIQLYRDAWRRAGHPGVGHVTLMVHTYVGEEMDRVRDLLRKPLCDYLRGSADMFVKLGLARKLGIASEQFTPDDLEAFVERGFQRFFDFNGLLGTQDMCLAMIERLEAIGVDEVACLIDFGLSLDDVMGGLQRLQAVKEVIDHRRPRVRQTPDDQSIVTNLCRYGVTHLQCTPAMARPTLAEPDADAALRGLQRIYVGGEALPASLAQQLRDVLHGQLWNMYGPTETTIWSTVETHCVGDGIVPIGRPIANTRLYVLDLHGQPVPRGVAGELFIGGDGVARGYFQRPELTAERFLPDPFRDEPGGRMYRTGDLVRYRFDGRLEFLGRLDHQVKVRGHRIELGEIETHLSRHSRVREAVVVARTDVSGEKQLVAFVVPATGTPAPSPDELRADLERLLPRYMVPSSFRYLASLPLMPNGKVDRAALTAGSYVEAAAAATAATPWTAPTPAPVTLPSGAIPVWGVPAAAAARLELAAARTPTERALSILWRGVLELDERVGIHDNFFALGGHSLQAAMIVSRIHEMFQVKLPLRVFFAAPDLAALAEAIDAARASGEVMVRTCPASLPSQGTNTVQR